MNITSSLSAWKCSIESPHIFDSRKILFFEKQLIEALSGKVTYPINFALSPSDFCNQSCIYCVSEGFRKSIKQIDSDQMEMIISSIVTVGSRSIIFVGGGEPLTNPFTINGITQARNSDLDVGLISNGVCINQTNVETIVNCCSFIRISIDSLDPKEYCKNRGATISQFEKVLQNISLLVNYKKKNKSTIIIGTQVVWNNQTQNEIENSIRILKSLQVDYVQIRPVDISPSKGFYPNWTSYKNFKSFFSRMITKYSDHHFRVIPSSWKFTDILNSKNNFGRNYSDCIGGNFTCAIGADMKVYFCCSQLGNSEYIIGDLRNEPLKTILESNQRKELITNCNISNCQHVCRNHEMNKLIEKIRHKESTQWEKRISRLKPNYVPLHLTFL